MFYQELVDVKRNTVKQLWNNLNTANSIMQFITSKLEVKRSTDLRISLTKFINISLPLVILGQVTVLTRNLALIFASRKTFK
jgi:hypothetical protein